MFQSTPPRGGRHQDARNSVDARSVSIHAPARGATRADHGRMSYRSVSIHAPARGATRYDRAVNAGQPEFQSTPPRGGRPSTRPRHVRSIVVSIHAPARGATQVPGGRSSVIQWFQSTPPRGGRPFGIDPCDSASQCFNPRPRAGGDLHDRLPMVRYASFNPRPRAGGDIEVAWP